MQFTNRNLIAVVSVVALICGMISALIQFRFCNGVQAASFCSPVVVCSLLAWRLLLHGRGKSVPQGFIIGAVAGVIGTLIFPTGLFIYGYFTIAHGAGMILPAVMILMAASFLVGGLIAATLTLGFPALKRGSSSSGPLPPA